MVKVRWDQLTRLLGQPALVESKEKKGLTDELPLATGRGSSQRQRKGKCHACREKGHSAYNCHVLKEEPMAVPTAEELLGAAEQPKTSPANATHATNLEGEGCLP
jgi:hypothetical protein